MAKMKYDEPMQIVSLRMPISMVKKLKRMTPKENENEWECEMGCVSCVGGDQCPLV